MKKYKTKFEANLKQSNVHDNDFISSTILLSWIIIFARENVNNSIQ
jgi:hypothetical protein